MGRLIDKICLVLAIFILSFILSITVMHKLGYALIVSAIISLITVLFVRQLDMTRADKRLTYRNFDTYMIVKGISYELDMLYKLYPNATILDKCIIYEDNIIMPILKFGTLSRDDVLKAYNIAKDNNINNVYIISNNIDRSSITFATCLYDVEFHFARSKELYNLMKERDILPILPAKIKKSKLKAREILLMMISHENAPRFLFTSFILLVIGLLTPLRTYYLVLSGISSLLSIVSLISRYHDNSRTKLPHINK